MLTIDAQGHLQPVDGPHPADEASHLPPATAEAPDRPAASQTPKPPSNMDFLEQGDGKASEFGDGSPAKFGDGAPAAFSENEPASFGDSAPVKYAEEDSPVLFAGNQDPEVKRKENAITLCEDLIGHFMNKAREARTHLLFLRTSAIILTLGVTIFGILGMMGTMFFTEWLIPIAGALAAVATALLVVFNPSWQWFQAQALQKKLRAEKFLYLQHAGFYQTMGEEEATSVFSERIIEIWDQGRREAKLDLDVEG